MKALWLTNEYPPHTYGGAGVHADYLSRELSRSIDVEVRCFGDQAHTAPSLKVQGYPFDAAFTDRAAPGLKSPLQAFSRCINFMADPAEADLVHCHTWYTHFGGILAQRALGIPLVITTHSLEPLRPWKREQLGGGYELSCWVEKAALESADAVIAVSREMKKDILEYFDVDPDRIHVVYNGIDTNEYRPVEADDALRRYGIDPNRPFVLFVGRVTRQKGIIHLVHAARHFDDDLQLALCAGAPDTPEIDAEMTQAVEALNRDGARAVWLRDMLGKEALIQLYSHATVFCCPSIYEPFGIINLEAMACGCPVVASAVGGIREVVQHGNTGMLVPLDQWHESPFEPKHPEQFARDLADAVHSITRHPDVRRKMGEAGRARAVEQFSWASIAEKTIGIYRHVREASSRGKSS